MLDERDLQAIAQLMDKKLEPINARLERLETKVDQQKAEIMHEVGALIEADVIPKFNLLADGMQLI